MRMKERATRQAQNLPTVSTKTGAIGSRILCDPMAPTSFLKQSESKQRPVLRSISARSISHRRGDETLLSCDVISVSCPLKAGFWFPRDGAKKRPPWGHKDQESERRLGPLLCRGPLLLSWTCLLASMIDCKRNRCGRPPPLFRKAEQRITARGRRRQTIHAEVKVRVGKLPDSFDKNLEEALVHGGNGLGTKSRYT